VDSDVVVDDDGGGSGGRGGALVGGAGLSSVETVTQLGQLELLVGGVAAVAGSDPGVVGRSDVVVAAELLRLDGAVQVPGGAEQVGLANVLESARDVGPGAVAGVDADATDVDVVGERGLRRDDGARRSDGGGGGHRGGAVVAD